MRLGLVKANERRGSRGIEGGEVRGNMGGLGGKIRLEK